MNNIGERVENKQEIQNPILPGFNPDPSICRVGDDYYIATSTFEWYPGVQIHHSKDLVNWTLVARPLNRSDLLDMTGEPDSCGVWAPCLTWHDGLFYLIYTDVKRFDGNFKDTHNYLTTCATIDGDWSARVYLNSSGFDPSLFHDDDGKKWFVNMVWDHRPDRTFFGGILLQEYSVAEKKLVGPIHNIFPGSELGLTEGPHLYKLNDYYYLLTAEGGTGYNHAMTFARSKNLLGPYEVDPIAHFVTAKDNPELLIQRAGHGDIVQTQGGDWYAVHLCSRPLPNKRSLYNRSPMGRETAIEKVIFTDDGWFRLANGGVAPEQTVDAPALPQQTPKGDNSHYTDFNVSKLPIDFQWLRVPDPSVFMSLTARPGYLRLFGKESLGSWFNSALIARRQQAFSFTATTQLEFSPEDFQQMAGLICYYNTHKYHYLYISHDENIGPYLGIMSCEANQSWESRFIINDNPIALENSILFMRAEVNHDALTFAWSKDGDNWQTIPVTLDYSLLSDEAGKGDGANFTGAFVGICCQDLTGRNHHADFKFFEYREK